MPINMFMKSTINAAILGLVSHGDNLAKNIVGIKEKEEIVPTLYPNVF